MNEEQEYNMETSHFNDGHGSEFEEQKVTPNTLAVDLDGTLAEYYGWQGNEHIGQVIPEVLGRMLKEIESGRNVIIFTARMSDPECIPIIRKWLARNDVPQLMITNIKYKGISEFWDDRAKEVITNTGIFVGEKKHKEECAKEIERNHIGIQPSNELVPNPDNSATSAFDSQVGGRHYKGYDIQPFVFIRKNNIPAAEGEIITHVVRHKDKNGREDLEKAIHLIQLIIESDY